MRILKHAMTYWALGAATSLLACAESDTATSGTGNLGKPGCTSDPDCGSCQDCMSACMCTTGSDESACSAACGDGSGGSGPGGTGGFGTGGVGAGPGGVGGSGVGGSGVGGVGGTDPGTGGFGTGGVGTGGTDPTGGTGAFGGVGGDTGGVGGGGTCCPSGDCLCHGPNPTGLTSANGPFMTATFTVSTGTVHYPTNADPPFAGVAIVGGFTNTGPEMTPWGTFYASHGIVTIVTTTTGLDDPATRATKLLGGIASLKAEHTRSGSPLMGKMAGRYGTSGYSMGGGGTTIASGRDATLKSSVGLAAWGPNGSNVQVPTLLLCGSSDTTAPCSMSQSAYGQIPNTTPKMMVTISGVGHLSWFGPTNAGGGVSGETALAFQKVYLEGDERWRPFLLQSRGTKTTNIQ